MIIPDCNPFGSIRLFRVWHSILPRLLLAIGWNTSQADLLNPSSLYEWPARLKTSVSDLEKNKQVCALRRIDSIMWQVSWNVGLVQAIRRKEAALSTRFDHSTSIYFLRRIGLSTWQVFLSSNRLDPDTVQVLWSKGTALLIEMLQIQTLCEHSRSEYLWNRFGTWWTRCQKFSIPFIEVYRCNFVESTKRALRGGFHSNLAVH